MINIKAQENAEPIDIIAPQQQSLTALAAPLIIVGIPVTICRPLPLNRLVVRSRKAVDLSIVILMWMLKFLASWFLLTVSILNSVNYNYYYYY